jgi:hypothetical protein
LAAEEGVTGMGDVTTGDTGGVLAGLLGNNLYGTLCGVKNKGPFWPQAVKPNKTSNSAVTVMIRGKENIY